MCCNMLYAAVGSYGAALMSYLEAGALESDFFETVVPESVWSQQVHVHEYYLYNVCDRECLQLPLQMSYSNCLYKVLRKMINCCCKLEYHTHVRAFSFLIINEY